MFVDNVMVNSYGKHGKRETYGIDGSGREIIDDH